MFNLTLIVLICSKKKYHDMRRWTVFFFKDSTCEKLTKELEIFLFHARAYILCLFLRKKNYLLYQKVQNHVTEASSTTTCFSHLFLRKLCEGFWLLFLLLLLFGLVVSEMKSYENSSEVIVYKVGTMFMVQSFHYSLER